MVKPQLPKLKRRVRFPLPAPYPKMFINRYFGVFLSTKCSDYFVKQCRTFDLYGHTRATASTPGGSPVTYAVGIVNNYDSVEDYGGDFINAGVSYNWLGIDYCRAPNLNSNYVSAVSITFGLPWTTGVNGYIGWDYYFPIKSSGGD